MRLSSPEFSDGAELPWSMSAASENRLPPLEIAGVPGTAASLALLLEDLDSPVGGLTHWLVWNLPPRTRSISAVDIPDAAIIGMNAFGKIGYKGPAPPEGRHVYRFSLLALDHALALASGATRRQFDAAVAGHVLATASLEGGLSRTRESG